MDLTNEELEFNDTKNNYELIASNNNNNNNNKGKISSIYGTYGIFIGQRNQYTYLSFLKNADWQIIRLIWIAFLKTNNNQQNNRNTCFLAELSKDLIKHIVSFLVT